MYNQYKKKVVWVLIAYLIVAVGFYLIAGDQLHYADNTVGMLAASTVAGEIVPGVTVNQRLSDDPVMIRSLEVMVVTYGRENTGHLQAEIQTDDGQVLYSTELPVSEMQDYMKVSLLSDRTIRVPEGQGAVLVLTSADSAPGNAVTVAVGSTVTTGKFEVDKEISDNMRVLVNGSPLGGSLCYEMQIRETLRGGSYYWYIAAAVGIGLALFLLREGKLLRDGKTDKLLDVIITAHKYKFLISQIVNRDFQTKYKRSVLGVLWSFLNPLMTMMVQYVVFSTLFRSNIEKYPLYLLTGIITFNFFNEATNGASNSIVWNTSLITKVYIPKIIYPVCQILFSTINLLISFILLLIVMLLTRTYPTPAFLLVPYGILCLVLFCTGVGLVLATCTVFFKDTQFLWGVFTMVWMYMTPIFYPESIIPERFLALYRLNPLYQFVTFLRTVLIQGISPAPSTYAMCFLCAVIPLVLGIWVFNRNQDKFIFHL